jgi:hypothetical protein
MRGLPLPQPALCSHCRRGYDAHAIVELVRQHGGEAHIPTSGTAKFSAPSILAFIASAT